MTRSPKTASSISDEVRSRVLSTVERFNRDELEAGRCSYKARFTGPYCYLSRDDYGREGPICRLRYNSGTESWEFAIFKWSSESYDPDEWMFPGSELVDGTLEGAMRAGMEAYPA